MNNPVGKAQEDGMTQFQSQLPPQPLQEPQQQQQQQPQQQSIWNPAFMSNASGSTPPQGQQTFTNPWTDSTNSIHASPAQRRLSGFNQQLPTTYEAVQADSQSNFRRRNSSLVIPPTRAAGPDPFLYDAQQQQQQQQIFPFYHQLQQYSINQDAQRRQSVAVAGSYNRQSLGYLT